MYSADDLLKLVKKAAVDAVNASKPVNIVFGKVISTSPLKIKIDQKLIVSSAQLVLTRNVTNYSLPVTLDGYSRNMTVSNALKTGENVIMVQVLGGQKYIVIDRIGKG